MCHCIWLIFFPRLLRLPFVVVKSNPDVSIAYTYVIQPLYTPHRARYLYTVYGMFTATHQCISYAAVESIMEKENHERRTIKFIDVAQHDFRSCLWVFLRVQLFFTLLGTALAYKTIVIRLFWAYIFLVYSKYSYAL